ncbi:MAG: SufE family protein [Bacteroidales bacterium]|nr:SufE family protein [Bacteroidales bacterium]
MQTITEIQNEIIEEFSMFEEWMDKYEYVIDLGKGIETLSEDLKKDEFLIKGCQSRVWLVPKYEDEKIIFSADSDAIITKGIASLVIRVFSNRTPDEIINADIFFVDKIGLAQNLSPTRANGLASMIDKIKHYATLGAKN